MKHITTLADNSHIPVQAELAKRYGLTGLSVQTPRWLLPDGQVMWQTEFFSEEARPPSWVAPRYRIIWKKDGIEGLFEPQAVFQVNREGTFPVTGTKSLDATNMWKQLDTALRDWCQCLGRMNRKGVAHG